MQYNRSKLAGMTLIAVAFGALATAGVAENGPAKGPRMGHGFGMERIFAELDADKDGKVTKAEVEAWKAAQPKVADTNGDGKISADELAAPRIAEATKRANDRAAEQVTRLDTDGDGLLSAAELAQGPGFGPQHAPDMGMIFDRIDTDKDGAITKEEAQAVHARMKDRREGPKRDRRGNRDHGLGKGPRGGAPEGHMVPPPAPEGGN